MLTTNVSLNVSQSIGTLTFDWPVTGSGYTLVSSPQLGPGATWTPVNVAPSIVGMNNQVILVPTNVAMFFRLQSNGSKDQPSYNQH